MNRLEIVLNTEISSPMDDDFSLEKEVPFGLITGIKFDVITETDRVKYSFDLKFTSATCFFCLFSLVIWHPMLA